MGHALDHSLISLGELGGPAGFTHEAPNTHKGDMTRVDDHKMVVL